MKPVINYPTSRGCDLQETLYYDRFKSSVGQCYVAYDVNETIVYLGFHTVDHCPENKSQAYFKKCSFIYKSLPISRLQQSDITLYGTPFQQQVWQQLILISVGKPVSYQDIAHKINKPNAQRAVGHAIGQNPVCILIPCHRVIYKSGKIGHYAWGHNVKQRLLDLEIEDKQWLK